MDNNNHLNLVFGNSERVFINFRIGCNCGCSYCYLPNLPGNNSNNLIYNVDEIYRLVVSIPGFNKGKDGTILSFGCYSESWCDETRLQTIELMCKLAGLGNHMQLSTKMQIRIEDMMKVDKTLSYENQLLVYISIPTITYAEEYEPGAYHPDDRISVLKRKSELNNIRFVLYIRPVLEEVTIQDLPKYGEIMKSNNIPCIVGNYFIKTDNLARGLADRTNVGEGYLEEIEPKDAIEIVDYLRQYGKVYRHSVEYINELEKKDRSAYV